VKYNTQALIQLIDVSLASFEVNYIINGVASGAGLPLLFLMWNKDFIHLRRPVLPTGRQPRVIPAPEILSRLFFG